VRIRFAVSMVALTAGIFAATAGASRPSWWAKGQAVWVCQKNHETVAVGTKASIRPTPGLKGLLSILATGRFTAGCKFRLTDHAPSNLVGMPRAGTSRACWWVFPHGIGAIGHRKFFEEECWLGPPAPNSTSS
jgi:hypothetical protein